LIEIFIIIAIILILAVIAIPSRRYGGSRIMAREKACYANMRVLLGATEMYNMDNEKMLSTVSEKTIEKLIEGKYLKSKTICPEEGTYGNIGDLTEDGVISCSVHGSVEEYR
jgi:competence protein ComGC